MNFQVKLLKQGSLDSGTTIMAVFEDFELQKASDVPLDFLLQIEVIKDSEHKEFNGKKGEVITLFNAENATAMSRRLILIGLGKKIDYNADRLREAFGQIGSICRSKKYNAIGLILPDRKISRSPGKDDLYQRYVAVFEGMLLGAYNYDRYKMKRTRPAFQFETITVYSRSTGERAAIKKALDFSTVSAEVTNLARDLTNTPSNDLTPRELVDQSRKIAKKYGLRIRVISGKGLIQNKLSGIISVGKGSENPPHFIILEYIPKKGKLNSYSNPLVFVGKAVCFDSGGISLKPSANMDKMKNDMGGGAAVIASIAGLAALKVPIRAIGLVPAVENLPSGSATKPGDIIKYSNNKTVEILNTDAEGRLILADALVFADRYNPVAVVDIATLTGSCVVALGQYAAGLMGSSDKLMDTIEKISAVSGEKVWRLPLWQPYRDDMKSDIADIKNVDSREGGAIKAAAFLLEFAENYDWAHLDIAGMAWANKARGYTPKGATGYGTRLLLGLGKAVSERKTKF